MTAHQSAWRHLGICFGMAGLLMGGAAKAQWEFGVGFQGAFPKEELKDHVDDEGVGLSAHFGYSVRESPVMVGMEFGFINYGSTTADGPFLRGGHDIDEIETTNNIVTAHMLFRIQPQMGGFSPYAEGLLGFKHFFTTTKVRYDWDWDDWDDDDTEWDEEFDDTTFSYGLGAGFLASLNGPRVGERRRGTEVLLHMGARYLLGSEAEYVAEDSVMIEDGHVIYDVVKSDTDLLTVNMGLVFRF